MGLHIIQELLPVCRSYLGLSVHDFKPEWVMFALLSMEVCCPKQNRLNLKICQVF
jgi:hypothetical protein